ncbi:MAG: peptide-methionine (R)-S-oxide reductase MsrB [Chloroflexota bacterium]|nr:peptide-methionine (R)-S-oxide reductase MsrB [Chloroflexota bacterium]
MSQANTKITKSDAEWRAQLTPDQYRVLREHGTERPFTGKYVNTKTDGTYLCAACEQPLFASDTKFESGSGWPSFWDVVQEGNVEVKHDYSYGMHRIEVLCGRCGGHLGHVFEDGPRDKTGLRYCINSAALTLAPNDDTK